MAVILWKNGGWKRFNVSSHAQALKSGWFLTKEESEEIKPKVELEVEPEDEPKEESEVNSSEIEKLSTIEKLKVTKQKLIKESKNR